MVGRHARRPAPVATDPRRGSADAAQGRRPRRDLDRRRSARRDGAPVVDDVVQDRMRAAHRPRRRAPRRARDLERRLRHRRGHAGTPRLGPSRLGARGVLRPRPDDHRGRRARRVGTGAAARAGRLHGDDDVELRVRQRPDHGRAVHRDRDRHRRARRGGEPRPLHRGAHDGRRRPGRGDRGGRDVAGLPPRQRRRRAGAVVARRSARPAVSRSWAI